MFLTCESDCRHHLDDPATNDWGRPPGHQLHHLRRRLPTGRVMGASFCTAQSSNISSGTWKHPGGQTDYPAGEQGHEGGFPLISPESLTWILQRLKPWAGGPGQVGGYSCHLDPDQRYLNCWSLMLTDIPDIMKESLKNHSQTDVSYCRSDWFHSLLLHKTHVQVSEPVNSQLHTSISGSVDRSLVDKSYLCSQAAWG